MKNFKKILAAVLSAAMVVTLAPAGVATNVQAAAKATKGTSTLKVSATKATIKVGKTKTIKVTVNKKQTAALKVTLKSSKASVAKVASKATIKKGAKTTSFKITAKKAGKANITVSYKTSANKTVKKTIKVTVKNSEVNEDDVTVTDGKITLVDAWGLQPDGTGFIGDLLRVNVPQNLGTMQSIIWYHDGNLIQTSSMTGDGNTINADVDHGGAGEYYAVAITTKGTTYKSNSIKISENEAAAVIKDFKIEDEYTDGTSLSYDTSDADAVVTVTLNKNYPGAFKIYKKSDSKHANIVGKGVDHIADEKLSTVKPTAYAAYKKEMGYRNTDGSVTYMFKTPAALTRGTEYVVCYDQTNIATDDPTTGTANQFETAVAAPYLEAPEAIAITSVSAGDSAEITIYGKDNKVLSWMNKADKKATTDFGFDSVVLYSNTAKAAEKGTKLNAVAETGKVVKGVYTTSNVADTNTYFYAEATTTKGIFGEKSVKLTSEVKDVAQKAADAMQLVQNGDTPTSADVKFTNLRTAGKVYIIQGSTGTGAKAADLRVADFDANDTESFVTSLAVDKGTATATVAGAISEFAGNNKDTYAAVFVPDDTANYSKVVTADLFNTNGTVSDKTKDNHGLTVSQAETTYKVVDNVSGASNGTSKPWKVEAYDQFGNQIKGTLAGQGAVDTTASGAKPAGLTPPTLEWDIYGVIKVTPRKSGTGEEKVGDKYTVKVGKTTFTIEVVTVGTKYKVSV